MTEIKISVGDIVLSTKGRDKDQYFLVVDKLDKIVYLADGKYRKVTALKKKNVKHLKIIEISEDLDFKSMKDCDIIYRLKSIKNNKMGGML